MADQVNCRQCFSFRDGEKPVCSNPKSGVGFLSYGDISITLGHCPHFAPRDNMIDDEGTIVFSSMPIAGATSSTAEATPREPIHDRIRRVGVEVADLCREKNLAYGSSFQKTGEFLRLLYPDGIRPEQYVDLGLLFRIFDKQMRIATRKDAFGESPWKDISGYGMMGAANDGDRR
jgi:hypothetical protein